MSLITEISRITSMMKINESTMLDSIQLLVNLSLERIQDIAEALEMGLGEMDELNEITSIDKIVVTNYVNDEVPVIYVDLYVNSDRSDYDNVMGEIEINLDKYIPNIAIEVNNTIDSRTLGSDID
jgi:hypothetical protein